MELTTPLCCLIVTALSINTISASSETPEQLRFLMQLLQKPMVPERITPQTNIDGIQTVKVSAFSWTNCGSTTDLAQIQTLTLSPDPLKVPGNVTVSASGTLKTNLAAPISVDFEIKKKVWLWITIPCVDNLGSCHYDDICSMLATFKCPPEFPKYGLPCKCPVKAGSYKLPPTAIAVDPTGVPKWAEGGDYKIQAKATYKGQQVMCINLDLSLTSKVDDLQPTFKDTQENTQKKIGQI